MGGHCDGGGRMSAWEIESRRERKTWRDFKPSCGYVAIARMLAIDVDELKERFKAKVEDALSCQDIMKIVDDLSSTLNPDCRYCTMKRTTLDLPPLLRGMTGIVALKEKEGNASLWMFVDEDGVVYDANGRGFSADEIKKYVSYADGYGHKIVFWDPLSTQFLDNVYLAPQKKTDCSKCTKRVPPFDSERRAISF